MTTRATELLRVVHARPGVTRADAARLIGVGTGATTELVGRLGQAELLAEGAGRAERRPGPPDHRPDPAPARTADRGRLHHPRGVAGRRGRAGRRHPGHRPAKTWPAGAGDEVVAALGAAVSAAFATSTATGSAASASRSPARSPRDLMLDASNLGWHDVDLAAAWPEAEIFVAGNDATLAASAESQPGRSGRRRGSPAPAHRGRPGRRGRRRRPGAGRRPGRGRGVRPHAVRRPDRCAARAARTAAGAPPSTARRWPGCWATHHPATRSPTPAASSPPPTRPRRRSRNRGHRPRPRHRGPGQRPGPGPGHAGRPRRGPAGRRPGPHRTAYRAGLMGFRRDRHRRCWPRPSATTARSPAPPRKPGPPC